MTYVSTRRDAQRVAAHVLARARHAVEGRIGLRVTPGGFGTPVLRNGVQVRVEGLSIIREADGGIDRCPLTSMRACAILAGVDLDRDFDVGHDTPPIGEDTLRLDPRAMQRLTDWFAFGWEVLTVVRGGDVGDPSEIELWPEHFDAAFHTTSRGTGRVNLGVSPGDAHLREPYLYVGPWGPERPGEAAFWNAPFGATLQTTDAGEAIDFFSRGLAYVRR